MEKEEENCSLKEKLVSFVVTLYWKHEISFEVELRWRLMPVFSSQCWDHRSWNWIADRICGIHVMRVNSNLIILNYSCCKVTGLHLHHNTFVTFNVTLFLRFIHVKSQNRYIFDTLCCVIIIIFFMRFFCLVSFYWWILKTLLIPFL